jgi:hypothetical protein
VKFGIDPIIGRSSASWSSSDEEIVSVSDSRVKASKTPELKPTKVSIIMIRFVFGALGLFGSPA